MGSGMMKDVITPPQHLYPYCWSLEDAVFTKAEFNLQMQQNSD